MSARYGTTLVLLDVAPSLEKAQLEEIQRFLFLYLLHPMLNNERQKKSITFHPVKTPGSVIPTPMDWDRLVTTIEEVQTEQRTEKGGAWCLITSLNQLLLYISSTGKHDFHLVVVSSFDDQCTWSTMYEESIKGACRSLLSMSFVDASFGVYSEIHDTNLKKLKTLAQDAVFITLSQAIDQISKYENMTLPNPEPVDVFNGSMTIPIGISDNEKLANLTFKVQVYPLVKAKILSNYVDNKLLTASENTPNKVLINYIERRILPGDSKQRIRMPIEEEHVRKGLRVGSSQFISDIAQFETIDTFKTLTIYGFTEQAKVIPWYLKPDCVAIMQAKGDCASKDVAIFTDLAQHLAQHCLVALAKLVKKAEAPPKQVVLFPRGYVDDRAEKTGAIQTMGFIMVECIHADDERIPSLPNVGKVEIEDSIQKEMDQLVDHFAIVEKEDLTFDESLLAFKKSYTPFDKFVNLHKPVKEELLIDGTFTGKWRNTVSINEEQKLITSHLAFETLKGYLNEARKDIKVSTVPSLWDIYHSHEEANKLVAERIFKENWHIQEPVFQSKSLDSVDWGKLKFEKQQLHEQE